MTLRRNIEAQSIVVAAHDYARMICAVATSKVYCKSQIRLHTYIVLKKKNNTYKCSNSEVSPVIPKTICKTTVIKVLMLVKFICGDKQLCCLKVYSSNLATNY